MFGGMAGFPWGSRSSGTIGREYGVVSGGPLRNERLSYSDEGSGASLESLLSEGVVGPADARRGDDWGSLASTVACKREKTATVKTDKWTWICRENSRLAVIATPSPTSSRLNSQHHSPAKFRKKPDT